MNTVHFFNQGSPGTCLNMKIFSRTETDVRAFTFVELLIIVTTVAVFVGLLLPALVVTGQKSSRIQCATNLKNIGLGFRISGTSHGDRFPIRVTIDEKGTGDPADSTQAFQYFQAFSNEWNNPKILVCPADSRQPDTRPAPTNVEHRHVT